MESPLGENNNAFEMEDTDEDKTKNFNRKSLSAFKKAVENVGPKRNAFQAISNAKASGTRWRKYVTCRRLHKEESESADVLSRTKTSGLGLDEIHDDYLLNNKIDGTDGKRNSKLCAENNRALIHYFADLGRKQDDSVNVNLDFIESLLKGGAQVDCTDKHGQTVLHEVARAWHSDVAKFLIEQGADVNQPDKFGRTPLHVAAAVDYPEMVNLLIDHGADKEALTDGELQGPVHYAAKHDACLSLKALIKRGCEFRMVRDYKGRTPIHVAAELDRSETARLLLELGAPVGVSDNCGQKAITLMITKMPPVAKDALDQFHKKYRAERKQYYFLSYLIQENSDGSEAQSPMLVAVAHKQHDILTHKVMLKLLRVDWKMFASQGAWVAVLFNFFFILLWTIMGVVVEYDKRHVYVLPDQWWRVVLFIAAVFLTIYQIADELIEYNRSRKSHNKWKAWREKEIERDLVYAHPQWPEEANFLWRETENLDKIRPKYFSDWWNVFDWVCYILLLASIITHIADVAAHSDLLARWHIRILAFTIILLWLRLMKNARAFERLGPFIVILAHMFGDVFKFAFLYLVFYIPYACAFWMMFGGKKLPEDLAGTANATEIVVNRFQHINEVLFSLFRLTLVDEYDYDNMKLVDSLMADILLGSWFALSAILCLNLFIALLSDTFQRVYDNAQANAVMQKAITVLSIWDSLGKKRKRKFLDRLKKPIEDDYDDDVTISGDEDLKKVTIQIKDQLDELEEKWNPKKLQNDAKAIVGSGMTMTEKDELAVLRDSVDELRGRQDYLSNQFQNDMQTIKSLLLQLTGHSGGGDIHLPDQRSESHSVQGQGLLDHSISRDNRDRPRKKKKRPPSSVLDNAVTGLPPRIPAVPSDPPPGYTPVIEVTSVDSRSPAFTASSPRDRGSLAEPAVRLRTGDFWGEESAGVDPNSEC
ncbi:transient receptor potential cation channel subfamily V member 2-like [Liolophura sinensis]|uniref:transient receptor potential cation channel subfamily V member 2-like n=1 Tax=Liolophura sinensis TaxID=3198878 RepID=UPI00315974AE